MGTSLYHYQTFQDTRSSDAAPCLRTHLSQNGVQVSHQKSFDRFVSNDGESPHGGRLVADVSQTGQVTDITQIHVGKSEGR